eukprot:gene29854-39611_t
MSESASAPKTEWRPTGAQEDIERLVKLLKTLEDNNVSLLAEAQTHRTQLAAAGKKTVAQEKEKTALLKKIAGLESKLKFEKLSSEGLRKRFNLIELE